MITDAVEIEKLDLGARYVDGADLLRADSRRRSMASDGEKEFAPGRAIPVTYDTAPVFFPLVPMK